MRDDRILTSFLEEQFVRGMELARSSDLLELIPVFGAPPSSYIARFHSRGYVKAPDGRIVEGNRFDVGIFFGPDYLRRAEPFELITWLAPESIHHPNVKPPFCCIGRIAPGMPLVDILYQLYEVIGWMKVTVDERDSLSPEVCAWARANPDRYPIERRPLKRRAIRIAAQTVEDRP